MESIDNYDLLLALMHGVPALQMLVTMLLGVAAQRVRRGLTQPRGNSGPAFAFAGVFLAVFVALGTVYLGEQVLPTLFFMLGWSQAWLQRPDASASAAAPALPQDFRRVIA